MSSSSSSPSEDPKIRLFSHPLRRPLRLSLRHRRRRMPTVHLGGGRRGWRAGRRFIAGFLRRIHLRFLVSHYLKAIKRIKACYSDLMRDIADGAATMEAVQARVLMETYLAVPIMPVSVAAGNYLR